MLMMHVLLYWLLSCCSLIHRSFNYSLINRLCHSIIFTIIVIIIISVKSISLLSSSSCYYLSLYVLLSYHYHHFFLNSKSSKDSSVMTSLDLASYIPSISIPRPSSSSSSSSVTMSALHKFNIHSESTPTDLFDSLQRRMSQRNKGVVGEGSKGSLVEQQVISSLAIELNSKLSRRVSSR
jgi:hypothetical protein